MSLDRVHLVVEPAGHLRELGVVGAGEAVGVEVVAEERHGRLLPGVLERAAQRDQDGLAALRRLPGVPDQEERLRHGVGLDGGRSGRGRGLLGGGRGGRQQEEESGPEHPQISRPNSSARRSRIQTLTSQASATGSFSRGRTGM